jgi:hypothetical protein
VAPPLGEFAAPPVGLRLAEGERVGECDDERAGEGETETGTFADACPEADDDCDPAPGG